MKISFGEAKTIAQCDKLDSNKKRASHFAMTCPLLEIYNLMSLFYLINPQFDRNYRLRRGGVILSST